MSILLTSIVICIVALLAIMLYVKPQISEDHPSGKMWSSVHEGGLTRLLMVLTLWLTTGGEILTKNGSTLKVPGIGVSWNKIITPIFNMIPGFMISLLLFLVMTFFANYFSFGKTFMALAQHWLVWLIITTYLAIASLKKYNNEVVVAPLTAVRLEVQNQGIVQAEKILSPMRGGSSRKILNYSMLNEGRHKLPPFASISKKAISLAFRQLDTKKLVTTAEDGVQIESEFSERFIIDQPGLYFSVEETEKKEFEIKKAVLENSILDLVQRIPSEIILSLSGKQIKKILLANANERETIRNSRLENYVSSVKGLEGVQKVIQDIFVTKIMWIDMRFSPEAYEEVKKGNPAWKGGPTTESNLRTQENEARVKLQKEFVKFREAILPSIGRVTLANEKLGVYTDDITQREMNYASAEVKKVAEQRIITKMQMKADSTRINWLKNKVEELTKLWKEHKITAQQAIEYIQVEFGKRTAYNFDGDGNVQPLITVKP